MAWETARPHRWRSSLHLPASKRAVARRPVRRCPERNRTARQTGRTPLRQCAAGACAVQSGGRPGAFPDRCPVVGSWLWAFVLTGAVGSGCRLCGGCGVGCARFAGTAKRRAEALFHRVHFPLQLKDLLVMQLAADFIRADLTLDLSLDRAEAAFDPTDPQTGRAHCAG